MPTVVLSAFNVANNPDVGGHFWVYLQYALGLRAQGCDVYWLEWFTRREPDRDRRAIDTFLARMAAFGFGDKVALFVAPKKRAPVRECELVGMSSRQADEVFDRADLLLNFYYAVDPELLDRFRRTALVDIDPGLLQHWMQQGQIRIADHDYWFTTGETIGRPGSRVPSASKPWRHIRPCVSVEHWPVAEEPDCGSFTTISSWQSCEWVKDDRGFYENNKRVTFLDYRDLPRRATGDFELALACDLEEDGDELQKMRDGGWTIRHSRDVAASPEAYRDYVRSSRAELSCAKPSCMKFQNAWISDRTLCYLASGRPAIVQDTGPSEYLPSDEGLFRFSSPDEAAAAIEAVNGDYARHRETARALAEHHFDARKVTRLILENALATPVRL